VDQKMGSPSRAARAEFGGAPDAGPCLYGLRRPPPQRSDGRHGKRDAFEEANLVVCCDSASQHTLRRVDLDSA
jgi:hypothetical protein